MRAIGEWNAFHIEAGAMDVGGCGAIRVRDRARPSRSRAGHPCHISAAFLKLSYLKSGKFVLHPSAGFDMLLRKREIR